MMCVVCRWLSVVVCCLVLCWCLLSLCLARCLWLVGACCASCNARGLPFVSLVVV